MQRSRVIVWFASVAVSTAGATVAQAQGGNPNGRPFIELQGQIVEIEGEVSTLQDQVESLIGRVDSLESEQAATNVAIASLQEQNAVLQDQIDANAADIDSVEDAVAVLQEENAYLQQQIDANRGNLASAQAQIAVNSGLISSLQQSLSQLGTNLEDQIDNNLQLIGVMQSRVLALEAAMTTKQNLIAGNCPSGQAIREVLPSGSVVCDGPRSLRVVQVFEGVNLRPGHTNCALAYCPTGYQLVGVGFGANNMHVTALYMNPGAEAGACFTNPASYEQIGVVFGACLRDDVL